MTISSTMLMNTMNCQYDTIIASVPFNWWFLVKNENLKKWHIKSRVFLMNNLDPFTSHNQFHGGRCVANLINFYSCGMFLPLDLFLECGIEHVTIGPLHIKIISSTMIFTKGVPGFAAIYTSGVWCHWLNACLPLACCFNVGKRALNDN